MIKDQLNFQRAVVSLLPSCFLYKTILLLSTMAVSLFLHSRGTQLEYLSYAKGLGQMIHPEVTPHLERLQSMQALGSRIIPGP